MCALQKPRPGAAATAPALSVLEVNVYFLTAIFLGRWIGYGLSRFNWGYRLGAAVATQVIIFGILPLLFVLRVPRRDWAHVFRLRGISGLTAAKCLVLAAFNFLFAQGIAAAVLTGLWRLGLRPQNPYEQLLADQPPLWLMFLAMAAVPALLEEWAFRGLVLSGMQRLGARAWIWAGLVFALAHGSLVRLPGLLALGMIFAFAAQRTGSLLPGLIMHIANNGIALALAFLVRKFVPMSVTLETSAPSLGGALFWLMAAALSLPVILMLLRSLPDPTAPEPAAPEPDMDPDAATIAADATDAAPAPNPPVARSAIAEWLPVIIALFFIMEAAVAEVMRMLAHG